MLTITHDILNLNFSICTENEYIKSQLIAFFSGFKIINNSNNLNQLIVVKTDNDKYKIFFNTLYYESNVLECIVGKIIHLILTSFLKSLENKIILHGAALETPKGAICFIGKSREGKSTITMCLLQENKQYRYITDDIIVLINGQIIPFPKPIFIRDFDTWLNLKDVAAKGKFINEGVERYWYLPQNITKKEKLKITRIIKITRTLNEDFNYLSLHSGEAFKALLFNLHNNEIFAPNFIRLLGNIVCSTDIGEMRFNNAFRQIKKIENLLEHK